MFQRWQDDFRYDMVRPVRSTNFQENTMSKSSTKSKTAKAKAKPAKTTKAKTTKPRTPPTGLGNPTAKKSMNPQRTLDLKKAAVKEAGGKMVFAGRKWIITPKSGSARELLSRELAAMTVKELVSLI